MKNIIKINILILIVLLLYFSSRIIINTISMNTNNSTLIKTLYLTNINEPYIVYYNHGNILYKKGKYQEAIINYEKALSKHPPKKYICKIKINLLYAQVNNNNTYTIKNDKCFNKEIIKKIKEYQANNILVQNKKQNIKSTIERQNELGLYRNIDNFKYKSRKYR